MASLGKLHHREGTSDLLAYDARQAVFHRLSSRPAHIPPLVYLPSARRARLLAVVGFVALLTVSSFAQVSPPSSFWGKTVIRISIKSDATVRAEDYAGQITQAVGDPLDAAKVSESLKRLYATGRFQELRAVAVPEAKGVALIFEGRAQYFVGIVRIAGSLGGLDPRALVAAARRSPTTSCLRRLTACKTPFERMGITAQKSNIASPKTRITRKRISLFQSPPGRRQYSRGFNSKGKRFIRLRG